MSEQAPISVNTNDISVEELSSNETHSWQSLGEGSANALTDVCFSLGHISFASDREMTRFYMSYLSLNDLICDWCDIFPLAEIKIPFN
jgi:hypothetical protein